MNPLFFRTLPWISVLAFTMSLAATERSEADAADKTTTEDMRGIHEFRGTMGDGIRIGMSLEYNDDGRRVKGNYFYAKYCKEIPIEGEVDGRKIVLREIDAAGKTVARFTGEFLARDPKRRFGESPFDREVVEGTWSRSDGATRLSFDLSLEYIVFAPLEARYSGAGFKDDAQLDSFAQRFRTAILKHDAETVLRLITYPLRVNELGSQRYFPDAASLRRYYDTVFDAAFEKKLAQTIPYHMFAKYSGVMLGAGIVWFKDIKQKNSGANRTNDDNAVTCSIVINR